ncbi:hypothetical protein [Microbulbifer sp. A4B17]|uniref:hypothetical protein n=1 Tax=Microbulbifer sp. A4B17 TaxID=359370 RepID=UPI001EE14C05|nr:hypothetical protein [Microbulbifer sp. A4B17]
MEVVVHRITITVHEIVATDHAAAAAQTAAQVFVGVINTGIDNGDAGPLSFDGPVLRIAHCPHLGGADLLWTTGLKSAHLPVPGYRAHLWHGGDSGQLVHPGGCADGVDCTSKAVAVARDQLALLKFGDHLLLAQAQLLLSGDESAHIPPCTDSAGCTQAGLLRSRRPVQFDDDAHLFIRTISDHLWPGLLVVLRLKCAFVGYA